MTNIGPFVKRTRIDLRDIEEGGLFLISGPTGSGKSFIFDTICYALYGKTPSGREGHLASDHASIGDEPVIEFSFMVGTKEYMIRRTLDHVAHSKRGGGTTERKESASFHRVFRGSEDVGGSRLEPLATRKSDVHQRSVEILGLDMEQFARVMMIPQGEFRELLKAETKDREKLLRKLFDSHLYFDISDSLSKRYGILNDDLKESRSRNEARIDTIVDKVGLESGPGEGLTFKEWSFKTINDLNEDLEGSKTKEKVFSKLWNDQLKILESSREVFNTDLSLKNARERCSELKIREEKEIRPLVQRSELSSRAGHLRQDLGRFDELKGEKEKSLKDLEGIKRIVEYQRSKFSEISSFYGEHHPKKEKEVEDIRISKASLDRAKPGIREIEEIRSSMDPLKEIVREMVSRRDEHRRNLEIIERSRKEVEEEFGCLKIRDDLLELSDIRKTGEHLLGIMKQRSKTINEMEVLSGEMKVIRERVADKDRILRDLRRGRENSIASELASGLLEGEPCPVCGSRDHPDPRETSVDDVSVDEVSEAEMGLKKETGILSGLENHLSGLKANVEGYDRRSGEILGTYGELEGLGPAELEKKIMELKNEEELAVSSSKRKKKLEKARSELDGEHRKLIKEMSELDEVLNRKRVELEGLSSRFKDRSKIFEELDLDFKDPIGSLESRWQDLTKREKDLSNWMEKAKIEMEAGKEDLLKKEKELDLRESRSMESIRKFESARSEICRKIDGLEGIDNLEELRGSIMDENEERTIQKRIDDFRDELSGVNGRIKEYKKKLEGYDLEVPDEEYLAKEEERERTLKEEWKIVHGKMVNLEKDIEWVKGQIEEIERIRSMMGEKEKEISIVGKLAMQVKGNSNPKISLERFFLAQRFEEVLLASNHRLKILSGGRFLLRRSGIRDRKSKGGLDINVYDNHTGRERPANTLSGGQMFLSSLALALGLADVVQSRSGGIRMDALFIDEGFGSLDEETLQTALKVLAELRQGRMVGVISHVGELKRQIKTGFEVVPSPDGSTVRKIG